MAQYLIYDYEHVIVHVTAGRRSQLGIHIEISIVKVIILRDVNAILITSRLWS
jgi:hypothetical protein